MALITYDDKVFLNENASIPDVNKVKDTDMNQIKSVVNGNYTETTDSINEINTNLGGIILWTNPNPTSSFAAQTITLSSSDYDFYEIYCSYSNQTSQYLNCYKSIKGEGTIMSLHGFSTNLSARRKVDYNNATSLIISDANGDNATNNSYLIPRYIIGYKTGLFE